MVRRTTYLPSEFNHYRDPTTQKCVPYANTAALAASVEEQCARNAPEYDGFWYERTAVRKVPISVCTGGLRLDRGTQHRCPHTPIRHGFFWWLWILLLAGAIGFAAAYWWTNGEIGQYGYVLRLMQRPPPRGPRRIPRRARASRAARELCRGPRVARMGARAGAGRAHSDRARLPAPALPASFLQLPHAVDRRRRRGTCRFSPRSSAATTRRRPSHSV